MLNKQTMIALSILSVLVGCGGAGGSSKQTLGYKATYTAPTAMSTSVPVVQLNTALSTDQIAVFDVVADTPNTSIRGCVLNLTVDLTKVSFVPVPSGNEGATLGNVSTGGFGGTYGCSVAKLNAQGCSLMGTAIQAPGPAQEAQGTLLRFALQLQGTTVAGVVTTVVASGSGLLDANSRVISGTAPVIGRLEVGQI